MCFFKVKCFFKVVVFHNVNLHPYSAGESAGTAVDNVTLTWSTGAMPAWSCVRGKGGAG